MPNFIWIIIPIVIALVVVGAVYSYRVAKKRREDLFALAKDLGWSFSTAKIHSHDDDYDHFEIFRSGHSRYAFNTLSGDLEIRGKSCFAQAGDFHYKQTSGSGKHRRTSKHSFSYLIIHLPYARCPDLLIRREGFFDKLKSVFGFDDIDFESAEFSRKYYVQSPDKRFAYDVCHPRMIEFLLARQPAVIDLEHQRCCLSDGRSTWTADQFRSEIAFLDQFLELWPEHLTSQMQDTN